MDNNLNKKRENKDIDRKKRMIYKIADETLREE